MLSLVSLNFGCTLESLLSFLDQFLPRPNPEEVWLHCSSKFSKLSRWFYGTIRIANPKLRSYFIFCIFGNTVRRVFGISYRNITFWKQLIEFVDKRNNLVSYKVEQYKKALNIVPCKHFCISQACFWHGSFRSIPEN